MRNLIVAFLILFFPLNLYSGCSSCKARKPPPIQSIGELSQRQKVTLEAGESVMVFDHVIPSTDTNYLETTPEGVRVTRSGKYKVFYWVAYQSAPATHPDAQRSFELRLNNIPLEGSQMTPTMSAESPESGYPFYNVGGSMSYLDLKEGDILQLFYTGEESITLANRDMTPKGFLSVRLDKSSLQQTL